MMFYYLSLAAALGIAAVGSLLRRRSQFWGNALVIVGCLGTAGCLVWQLRQTMFPAQTKGPDRGQAVVAYYLANQVMRDAGERSGSILLLFPPSSVFDDEMVGTFAGTFNRVLRGFHDLDVQVLTLNVPKKAGRAGKIPREAFQQLISNAPPAVAYVSFAGVPADVTEFRPPGPKSAGFYVFDPWGTTNWLAGLKAGVVRTVIVPRPGVGRDREVAGEPGEVFNQLYLMATSATADKVAAQLAGASNK